MPCPSFCFLFDFDGLPRGRSENWSPGCAAVDAVSPRLQVRIGFHAIHESGPLTAMFWAVHGSDYSCEAYPQDVHVRIDADLASCGGVWDDDDAIIYQRLVDRAGFRQQAMS